MLTFFLGSSLFVGGCQDPSTSQQTLLVSVNEKMVDAAWVHYQTLEELVADADKIVLGEVQKIDNAKPVICGENSDGTVRTEVYTLAEIKVVDYIKGQGKTGETITVGQPGGLYHNIRYNWNDVAYFQPGMRAVFFLDEPLYEGLDMPYFYLGPIQGYIPVQGGKTIPREGNRLIEAGLSETSLLSQLKSITMGNSATTTPSQPGLHRQAVILDGQSFDLLLPLNWSLAISENLIELCNETKQKHGEITLVGYYDNYAASLPNHSQSLTEEDIDASLGTGKLFVLERSHPAAAVKQETWQEIYAIIPIPNKNLAYLFWIQADPQESLEVNKDMLRFIINHTETSA